MLALETSAQVLGKHPVLDSVLSYVPAQPCLCPPRALCLQPCDSQSGDEAIRARRH